MATARKTQTKAVSPLQAMLNEDMVTNILKWDVWSTENPADIVHVRETVGVVLNGLKAVCKAFDQALVDFRKIHGEDYLSDVNYFRKPRATDSEETENPLLSVFEV